MFFVESFSIVLLLSTFVSGQETFHVSFKSDRRFDLDKIAEEQPRILALESSSIEKNEEISNGTQFVYTCTGLSCVHDINDTMYSDRVYSSIEKVSRKRREAFKDLYRFSLSSKNP